MLTSQRHYGMDLVRGFATVTVMAGHGLMFFTLYFNILPLIFPPVFAVEVFFQLSGYLIGGILLEMGDRGLSLSSVRVFWLKRWFRTIPAYLFMVIATTFISGSFNWSQWLFVQNYFPEQMENFQVSWSLTIEEWFYLLFPLGMLLLSQLPFLRKRPGQVVIWTALLMVVLPWIGRFIVAGSEDVIWDLGIRKQIHLRLDAIAYGVLLSVWHYRRPADLLRQSVNRVFGVLALTGFIFCWWYFNSYIDVFSTRADRANAAFFYPLVSMVSLAAVAFSVRFSRRPGGWFTRAITLVSLTSYSMYLVHLPIYNWLSPRVDSVLGAWLWFGVALLVLGVVAGSLYKWVEQPFMKLRSRFDPKEAVSPHLGGAGAETTKTC